MQIRLKIIRTSNTGTIAHAGTPFLPISSSPMVKMQAPAPAILMPVPIAVGILRYCLPLPHASAVSELAVMVNYWQSWRLFQHLGQRMASSCFRHVVAIDRGE